MPTPQRGAAEEGPGDGQGDGVLLRRVRAAETRGAGTVGLLSGVLRARVGCCRGVLSSSIIRVFYDRVRDV